LGSQERTKEPPWRNPAMSNYRFRALKVPPGRNIRACDKELHEAESRAETAISRAYEACGKLSGGPYSDCLDRIPKCWVVLTKDVGSYRKGTALDIDGGSDDPGQLCQHAGDCFPISAVRFKTACMLVSQKGTSPPWYSWEPGDGSLSNRPAPRQKPQVHKSDCPAQFVTLRSGSKVWFTGKYEQEGRDGPTYYLFQGEAPSDHDEAVDRLTKSCPSVFEE
jgi:hypothetical protein